MEKPEDKVRVHLWTEGMVQGVFFRASAQERAIRLGLKGWVRNCADGSVEVVAEGEREKIDNFVRWCHHGPPGAHVHHIEIRWEDYRDDFKDFRIRR